MTERDDAVGEVQGLYGPFSFAEKVLQKIWLRGDFDRSAARLHDGRAIRISHPGKWNLLGGPDFKGARLAFGEASEFTGDVELHLHAADWSAHRHAEDPAYDRVALHVVLFPPEPGHVTRGSAGNEIPLLALLPLLPHDLEEFAADEAVEVAAGHSLSKVPEELASMEQEKLLALLRVHAAERWRRKVHFAAMRIERLGWEAACHHAALETLGYRFNRAAMLGVAGRWSLEHWAEGKVDPDEVFLREKGNWSLQGVRPANRPRSRLRQYAQWVRLVGDWPTRFESMASQLPRVRTELKSSEARREFRFGALRTELLDAVCGGQLGGTGLDNFIYDGLLPLHAAEARVDHEGIWFHWFLGDQPPAIPRVLRQLGVCAGRNQPLCHGFAQGIFQWFVARDARR